MKLRFAILKIEAKLLFLFAAESVILNPLAMILIADSPVFLTLLWILEGGLYVRPIAIYITAVLAIIVIGRLRFGSDTPADDTPLSKPLASYPALHELVKRTASLCRKPVPNRVSLSLSPAPWRRLGVDLRLRQSHADALPLPISCMETWSVMELETHIARTLVSREHASWPAGLIGSTMLRLALELRQRRSLGAAHQTVRIRVALLKRYMGALNGWRFLVDTQADMRVARMLGPGTLMSLISKTMLAVSRTPPFINAIIEPAIDKQALLPIAESYAAHIAVIDPLWTDGLSQRIKRAKRSPGKNPNSLIARLALLSTLPAGVTVHDPRPASTLISGFRDLQREVAANEFGLERVRLAVDADLGNAVRLSVIPQMRDEVARNSALLEGKTPFDIPQLLKAKRELASIYKTDPKLLLAHVQRVQRIPYLLGAFLALSLIDKNWEVAHEMNVGIELSLGARRIRPFSLVRRLDSEKISEAGFIDALNSTQDLSE